MLLSNLALRLEKEPFILYLLYNYYPILRNMYLPSVGMRN